MARNNNKMVKRRSKKTEPAVLKMLFSTAVVPAGTDATFNVDISQCASLLNRRFYRQGLNWAVGSIKVSTTGFIGSVITQTLPTTWMMSNAWHKGLATWEKMNDEALADTESVRPRFQDFKIYSNALHHQNGIAANLLPFCLDSAFPVAGAVTAQPGEWESAKITIPYGSTSPGNAVDREFIAVGASYPGISPATGANAVSLIEGYASSRGLPAITDPNTPDDASDVEGTAPQNWIGACFNEGTDQDEMVLENLITENNQSPYPFENGEIPGAPGTFWTDTQYPGGANQLNGLQSHDFSFITSTSIGGHTSIPGGLVPCGLLQFSCQNTGDTSANLVFEINLVPGSHRGYLAEPMQDM